MITRRFHCSIILYALFILTGCSITPLSEQGSAVKIVFNEPDENHCQHLGEVFGLEGNMFDFWFISNGRVIEGSLNDLKNKTADRQGNLVYIDKELTFNTSTAFLGAAYRCQ